MLEYLYYTSVYFLLVFLISLFHATNPQNEKRFVVLSFFLLFIFAAISYDVGWDYLPYYNSMTMDMTYERYELLEYYLSLLSIKLNFPQLFFIINHFVITMCISSSIYHSSKNVYISFIVFLCFPLFYLGGFSTIRFSAGVSIVLFGYVFFLKERKPLRFLLSLIIAYNCHASMLVALIIFPLYYLRFSKWSNVLLLIASFVFSKVFIGFIASGSQFLSEAIEYRLQWYMDSGGDIGGQSVIHYFFLALNIFNLIVYDKLRQEDEETTKFITLFNLGCCMAILFGQNQVLMSRSSRMFYLYIIFIIPYYEKVFVKLSPKSINNIIVILSFFLFAYQLAIPNYNGTDTNRVSTYWPYQVFFLHK